MAVVRLRPKGARHPELRFRGKTIKSAMAAVKSYLRKHGFHGFFDAEGIFHSTKKKANPRYSKKQYGKRRRKTRKRRRKNKKSRRRR